MNSEETQLIDRIYAWLGAGAIDRMNTDDRHALQDILALSRPPKKEPWRIECLGRGYMQMGRDRQLWVTVYSDCADASFDPKMVRDALVADAPDEEAARIAVEILQDRFHMDLSWIRKEMNCLRLEKPGVPMWGTQYWNLRHVEELVGGHFGRDAE